MSRIILLLFAFQLSLAVTFAQITFTREWVTGKRSASSSGVLQRREPCVSFMPTIEFLMDVEELQRRECPTGVKFAVMRPYSSGSHPEGGVLHSKNEDQFEPGTFSAKI